VLVVARPWRALAEVGLVVGRREVEARGPSFSTRAGQQLGVAAEQDVDAAAGHVGGDGDRAEPAGLGDDLGLTEVLLGVEHLVGMPRLSSSRDSSSDFSTEIVPTSTGWPLVALGDVVDDGVELAVLGLVDEVGLVDADDRLVGGDRHHAEAVGVHQLGGLGEAVPVMPASLSYMRK
jgi:hypothetical protein